MGQREVVTSRKVYEKAKTSHCEAQFIAIRDSLTNSTHQFVYIYIYMYIYINTHTHVQEMFNILGQNSGVSSPQQNKEKYPIVIGYMSANSFRGTFQQCANLSPLYFHIWGHLKPLVYSVLIEKEETLHQCIFDACRTNCNRSRTFKMV